MRTPHAQGLRLRRFAAALVAASTADVWTLAWLGMFAAWIAVPWLRLAF